jgi:hypothetical protein
MSINLLPGAHDTDCEKYKQNLKIWNKLKDRFVVNKDEFNWLFGNPLKNN